MKDKGREGKNSRKFLAVVSYKGKAESCQQQTRHLPGSGGLSTDRMSGSPQDRCSISVKSSSWTRKRQSKCVCPPPLASNSSAAEELEECLHLQLWDMKRKSQYLSPPSKSKCCAATRETPRKPLVHEHVFREPYGRTERSDSTVTHTEHTNNSLTESVNRTTDSGCSGKPPTSSWGRAPYLKRHVANSAPGESAQGRIFRTTETPTTEAGPRPGRPQTGPALPALPRGLGSRHPWQEGNVTGGERSPRPPRA